MITIVFRGRTCEASRAEVEETGRRLYQAVRDRPGFVELKDFRAEDGEELTIIRFGDLESVRAWRMDPEHRDAIHKGYSRWLETYDISVCQVLRHFTRGAEGSSRPRGARAGPGSSGGGPGMIFAGRRGGSERHWLGRPSRVPHRRGLT